MSAAKGEISSFVEGMGRVALLAREVFRCLLYTSPSPRDS